MNADSGTSPRADSSGDDAHAELLRRARAGDRAAAGSLIGQLRARIYRWALVHSGDPDDADDVAQAVSIQLVNRFRTFDGRSALASWVFAITRNACIDHLRRAKRGQRIRDEVSAGQGGTVSLGDALKDIGDREAAGIVADYFRLLPERQRTLIELVDMQGFTAAEAAELLEIDAATARVHLFRARRALRQRLLENAPFLMEDDR